MKFYLLIIDQEIFVLSLVNFVCWFDKEKESQIDIFLLETIKHEAVAASTYRPTQTNR